MNIGLAIMILCFTFAVLMIAYAHTRLVKRHDKDFNDLLPVIERVKINSKLIDVLAINNKEAINQCADAAKMYKELIAKIQIFNSVTSKVVGELKEQESRIKNLENEVSELKRIMIGEPVEQNNV